MKSGYGTYNCDECGREFQRSHPTHRFCARRCNSAHFHRIRREKEFAKRSPPPDPHTILLRSMPTGHGGRPALGKTISYERLRDNYRARVLRAGFRPEAMAPVLVDLLRARAIKEVAPGVYQECGMSVDEAGATVGVPEPQSGLPQGAPLHLDVAGPGFRY
jgi:endogenous inhibitor of DNA gyrase (YacG/DUF329 family)